MGRSISELDIIMQPKARAAWEAMQADKTLKAAGCTSVAISETGRELYVQMAYYSRGRMAAEDVQKMYAAAGLYKISEEEAKIKNTWTLVSKHIQGKAIDFVPVKDGKLWWTAPEEVWTRMGEIGEGHGLTWGGRWKEKDFPHFEI